MSKPNRMTALTALLVAALATSPALAQTVHRAHAPNRVAIGVGALATPDYEGSDDYLFSPAIGALIRVHGHSVSWRGTSLAVDMVPEYRDQKFKIIIGPFVNLNFDRASAPHDPVVSLMRKRKVALEGGGFIGFSKTGVLTSAYDTLTVRLSASYDLGNVHHSFIVTPTAEYLMPVSHAVVVGASASADVVGGRYARYYFGVGNYSSGITGLPVYRPGGGIKSMTLGLLGAVSLRGDLEKRGVSVGALVNYERLVGDFADSPLVAKRGNPNQFTGTVGIAYTF